MLVWVYSNHDGHISLARFFIFHPSMVRLNSPQASPGLRKHIRRIYLPDAIYFVTTCVRYRNPAFLDEAIAQILEHTIHLNKKLKHFVLYAYVIMPDHMHLLVRPSEANISEVMRSIKTNSSRDINRHNASRATRVMGGYFSHKRFAWQEKFYDHVIMSDDDFRTHIEYIKVNPVKAGIVQNPEDYPFLFVDEDAIRQALGLLNLIFLVVLFLA